MDRLSGDLNSELAAVGKELATSEAVIRHMAAQTVGR
jgi:hypothetical protein